jgi:flagellar motor switch protein FliN/FliY
MTWLETWLGEPCALGIPEVLDRASGLRRGGLVAQFSLPSLAARIGIGVEIPLAHAVVDRLLGFDRPLAESRLQLSPVEWGIWTFLFAKALDQVDVPPTAWPDLYLDRVGPDPFDSESLGKITTACWTAKLGTVTGTIRLWLPDTVVDRRLQSAPPQAPADPERIRRIVRANPANPRELASDWRARGGVVSLVRGRRSLRTGGVLPIIYDDLCDNVHNIELVSEPAGPEGRFRISARPEGEPGGKHLVVTSPVRYDPSPTRENSSMSGDLADAPSQGVTPNPDQPPNLPVTLTVELGRVSMTLSRLADLRPGDVIELTRHNREPVELTSNGRLVARGELVKIDTELGVRVTNVFL